MYMYIYKVWFWFWVLVLMVQCILMIRSSAGYENNKKKKRRLTRYVDREKKERFWPVCGKKWARST